MKVYTLSEARRKFASVLDTAQKDGAVRVTRRDGRAFTIQPVKEAPSPLVVKAVKLKLTREEIVSAVREGRERVGDG
jgi:prevent-host-death family protein